MNTITTYFLGYTSGGFEVDAAVGEGRVAIEVKFIKEAKTHHTCGLKTFSEDYPDAGLIIVSLDKYFRKMNDVEVIPASDFLKDLWQVAIM